MKKFIILTISLISIFPICSIGQDLKLDDILKKYYDVMNIKKMNDVKSIYIEGKIITQGMEMPFIQRAKKPGKVRIEVTVQGSQMVQAYNGETGFMIAPFLGTDEPQDMPEDQADQMKEQADFQGKLWNWKDKVENLELIGKEDLDGTPVYKLKMTEKSKENNEGEESEEIEPNVRYIYIDAKNFVELKIVLKRKMRGAEVEVEVYQSDFKKVDGILKAHSIEQKMGGQTLSQISIEKVEFNKEFEDSLFEKPVKK